jgi:L-lactate utilization protein LutC
MNRQAFLERVRQAARAGQAHRAHVRRDLDPNTGYAGGGPELCQRFADELTAVGGTAEIVDGLAAARWAVVEFLRRQGAASALCWRHALLEQLELAPLLEDLKIERLDHERLLEFEPTARRATMLAAGVGITSASWAIAETGTLVMAAAPGRERVASLLPPVHLAIIAESQLLPDLFDLFAAVQPAASTLPSNLVFITGPSKTGDIELQLTTGVHGPGTIHVIVIRGE